MLVLRGPVVVAVLWDMKPVGVHVSEQIARCHNPVRGELLLYKHRCTDGNIQQIATGLVYEQELTV